MTHDSGPTLRTGRATQRWECHCTAPPILLAMYEPGGQIEIKLRDRFYRASGCVHAVCPRCGTKHILDLRPADAPTLEHADVRQDAEESHSATASS